MSGAIVAAAIGAGASLIQGQQQKKAASKANRAATENALRQEKSADEAMNKANQKRADQGSLLRDAQAASKMGASGTMLTGSQGIDPNALNLGKNTLLGQ